MFALYINDGSDILYDYFSQVLVLDGTILIQSPAKVYPFIAYSAVSKDVIFKLFLGVILSPSVFHFRPTSQYCVTPRRVNPLSAFQHQGNCYTMLNEEKVLLFL